MTNLEFTRKTPKGERGTLKHRERVQIHKLSNRLKVLSIITKVKKTRRKLRVKMFLPNQQVIRFTEKPEDAISLIDIVRIIGETGNK